MTAAEIDAYLATLEPAKADALAALRVTLIGLLPDAEQTLSYGVPAFKLDGRPVAGFSAAARHLSYLPHSGAVLKGLDPALLEGLSWSKGAVKFTPSAPLPRALVEAMVAARLRELGR